MKAKEAAERIEKNRIDGNLQKGIPGDLRLHLELNQAIFLLYFIQNVILMFNLDFLYFSLVLFILLNYFFILYDFLNLIEIGYFDWCTPTIPFIHRQILKQYIINIHRRLFFL